MNRWWAPAKFDPVKSPLLFFEQGQPVVPPVLPDVGLDLVMKHMVWQLLEMKALVFLPSRAIVVVMFLRFQLSRWEAIISFVYIVLVQYMQFHYAVCNCCVSCR